MIGRICTALCVCGVLCAASPSVDAGSRCGTQSRSRVQTQVWVPRAAPACSTSVPRPVKAPCAPCQQAQPAPACVQMQTVYQAVPRVSEVDRVETVMTTQTRYETYEKTVMQPVYRTMAVEVTVPVRTMETMVGTRRVLQNVPVRVQRPVTSQCQYVQPSPCRGATVTTCAPVTPMVEAVEYRPVWVDQQYTFQAPVTNYVTQYQNRQVLEYQPTVQTLQVPVTVQVPVQRIRKERVVNYEYVPTQVPVVR